MRRQCSLCNARCCRYFCLPIDNPCTYEEFEQVRWYLTHQAVTVHADCHGQWWMLIENRCRWLEESVSGPRCVSYGNRPLICRQFSPRTCEFARGPARHEIEFESADQLEAYARDILGEKEFESARRASVRKRKRSCLAATRRGARSRPKDAG